MSRKNLKGRALVIRLDRDELRVALMMLGSAEPGVLHSVVLPVPEGAVDDGFIVQPEAVKEVLSTALLTPEFRRCNRAIFSLCTTQIITELTTAPVLSEKKLDKMLRSNMDMYFPVDTKDYNLVWKINGNAKKEGGRSELNIQLWAVPNSVLARYYALANDCGLIVEAIQWCGSSVVSYARGIHEPPVKKKSADSEKMEKESTLYVVAEREHMIVTIMQGQSVRSQRMFQCGPVPEMSLSEVAMLLDYYNTRIGSYGSNIKCVFGGKLAEDPDFIQSAQMELGMHITVADAPGWLLNCGASLADMDFGDPNMNRKGAIKRSMGGLWQYVLILICGGILALTAVCTLGTREIWKREILALESMQLQLSIKCSETKDYADNYNSYINNYAAYSTDWDTLFASVKTYNDNLVIMLDELESILPETTKVTDIAIQPTGLQLRIACPSKEEAVYVIMELRELRYADLLGISSLTGTTGQAAKPNPNEEVPTEGSGGGFTIDRIEDLLDKIQNGGNLGDLEDILGDLGNSGMEFAGISTDLVETITQLIGGKVDLSKLSESDRAALLRYGIDNGYITKVEVEEVIQELNIDDMLLLYEVYGKHLPKTEMSIGFLQSESTVAQKKAAIEEMLTTDRIARHYFSEVFNEDLKRESGEDILYMAVGSDLTGIPKAYSALLSGGEKELERYAEDIVNVLVKNDNVVRATENLICTNEDFAERYAWYLEQAIYYSDEDGAEDDSEIRNPYENLDTFRLATDIVNNTVSTALSAEAKQVTRDVRDAMMLRLLASGKLGTGDLVDILSYLKPNVSAPAPTPTPTTIPTTPPGKDDLADLLDKLLGGSKTPGSTGGNAQESDRNIYFDVVLGYDEALIAAEMERSGLDFSDKVAPPAELEVGQ